MNDLTIEQNTQLQTWSAQRDSLLREITLLNTEKEKSIKDIREQADSYTEISKKITGAVTRMEELDKKEKEWEGIMANEVAELSKKKTQLETVASGLEDQISILRDNKNDLVHAITSLTAIHNQVYNRVSVLDKVVDRVTRINAQNIDDVNVLISNLKKTLSANK